MPDRDSGEDLSRLVAELVTALENLEDELDPPEDRPLRPPRPSELRLFASDVAIPGLILVLESNIRALRLLQRALRFSEGTERTRREGAELGQRARDVSNTTLERLDDALVDLQDAVEGRPNDDEAADLLADARELRSEVQTRLREYADDATERARESGDSEDGDDGAVDIAVGEPGADESSDPDDAGADGDEDDATGDTDDDAVEDVGVDVDAELESIKRELDGNGATADDGGAGVGDGPDDESAGSGDAPDESDGVEDARDDEKEEDAPTSDRETDDASDPETDGASDPETGSEPDPSADEDDANSDARADEHPSEDD